MKKKVDRLNQLKRVLVILIITTTIAKADFTIGTMPDTQNLSEFAEKAHWVTDMAKFFADRKHDLNMKFVAALGDMTQNNNRAEEWTRVKTAYNEFAAADIPFAPCEGNHDSEAALNTYFPESEFLANSNSCYVGNRGSMENAYYVFAADGMDFVLVVTENQPSAAELSWASGIFSSYPDHRGILVTHFVYAAELAMMRDNDNVFMALYGHDTGWDRGERYHTQQSTGGTTQHLCMSDYQGRSETADGAMVRYYTFKPRLDQIQVKSFNIVEGAYEIDASSDFIINYDMESPPDDAEVTANSIAKNIFPGQSRSVELTFKNVGQTTWRSRDGFKLVDLNNYWGNAEISLDEEVPPGSEYTFKFTATAPSEIGMYPFNYKMKIDGSDPFGSSSLTYIDVSWPISNLIVDGSFDEGSAGWSGLSAYTTVSSEQAITGPHSLRLQANGVDIPDFSQTIPLEKNTDYNFRISFYYTAGSSGEIVFDDQDAFDATAVPTLQVSMNADTSGWTHYNRSFNSGDKTSVTFRMYMTELFNGTAYIDNIQLWNPNQVTVINEEPNFTSNPVTNAQEGSLYSYTIEAEDPNDDAITLRLASESSWLSLLGNQLSGVPLDTHLGTHGVTIEITDGFLTNSQFFNIIVQTTNISITNITSTNVASNGDTNSNNSIPVVLKETSIVLSGDTIVFKLPSEQIVYQEAKVIDVKGISHDVVISYADENNGFTQYSVDLSKLSLNMGAYILRYKVDEKMKANVFLVYNWLNP